MAELDQEQISKILGSKMTKLPRRPRFGESVQPYMHEDREPEEACLLRAFFEREKAKPPHLREKAAFLVCNCKRCRRTM